MRNLSVCTSLMDPPKDMKRLLKEFTLNVRCRNLLDCNSFECYPRVLCSSGSICACHTGLWNGKLSRTPAEKEAVLCTIENSSSKIRELLDECLMRTILLRSSIHEIHIGNVRINVTIQVAGIK